MLTATQVGALGELLVASQLVVASAGRLAPFQPVADDDGVDLLVLDKRTRLALPIQVKSRTGVDGPAGTVQFDVRLSTFSDVGASYLLGVLLDSAASGVRQAWLIPMSELATVARRKADKLVITPSAQQGSRDRYVRFRCDDMAELTARLLQRLDASPQAPGAAD